MKTYTGKNLEDILEKVSESENTPVDQIQYYIVEDRKTLFSRKIEICVYTLVDIIDYATDYLKKNLANLELEAEVKSKIDEGVIYLDLNTPHNAVLIGKNGRTLQALNDMVRNAISSTFKKRYRVLLDINQYKDQKYEKIVRIAKRVAKDVQRSKITAKLDPMTADERRVVHNALSEMENIKTESIGQGKTRQITIQYVGS